MQATRIAVAALVAGLLCPAPALAQTINAEVMKVLTGGQLATPGETYDLTIGALPKNFPPDLIPPGGRTVASTESPSMRTAVFEVAASEEAARGAHARALDTAGWVSPMPASRGFSPMNTISVALCRAFDHINVQYVPKSGGGTYVRIGLQHDPRRRCAPRMDSFFSDVPVPTLRHPEGVRAFGASSGGSSDGYHTGARIETTMTAAVLADHYDKQILSTGWTQVTRLADPNMVVVRYRASLQTGEALTAVLTVTTGDDRADLFLRITRPPSRSPIGGVTSSLVIRR